MHVEHLSTLMAHCEHAGTWHFKHAPLISEYPNKQVIHCLSETQVTQNYGHSIHTLLVFKNDLYWHYKHIDIFV